MEAEMRMRVWKKAAPAEAAAESAVATLAARLSHRQFLKALVAAVTGAGVGQLARRPSPVEAAYTPAEGSDPEDSVDRNLTVNGRLVVLPSSYVAGRMGVGITSPLGSLDVAGDIRVNGVQTIDSSGIARQCRYYGSVVGTWQRVGECTWGWLSDNNKTWADLQSL